MSGAVYGVATMLGLIAFIAALIPVSVVAPILVFVGMSMIATAFNSNHARYYPAVALAMLPYFANYLATRFNRGAPEVVEGIFLLTVLPCWDGLALDEPLSPPAPPPVPAGLLDCAKAGAATRAKLRAVPIKIFFI